MIPDKFNMVDMGGIDLILMQGEEVPGLYNRLVESIAQCRYQCLYNWLFDGVIIPPTYVEMEVGLDEEVRINEGVVVTSDDVIHIYSISPGPVDPEIVPLLTEENGTYYVPEGVDGFNPVTVDVPSYTPVINPITITENGTYTPSVGVDGYGPVTVDVTTGPPIYQLSEWESMTTEQKRSLGKIVIQSAQTGFELGQYVDASLYSPEPAIDAMGFAYFASGRSIELSATLSSAYTILLATTNIGEIQYLDIELNNESIKSNFSLIGQTTTGVKIYAYSLNMAANDTVEVSITTSRSDSGAQLFLLNNVDASDITITGAASNNNLTFTIPASEYHYLEVAKYGYYGRNTIPQVTLFKTSYDRQSIPCPNDPDYFYGGTYVLNLGV